MLETAIDTLGTSAVLALAGLGVGLLFGIFAERSSFCLRASTVELAEAQFGGRLVIWLLAFCTALFAVQALQVAGLMDLSDARVLAAQGSLSGAAIGGLLFGSGMILARGCASRLLVLSATGNLRALVTGLVLTLVAQASYTGILSPVRTWFSELSVVPGGTERHLAEQLGVAPEVFIALAALVLGLAWWRGAMLEVRLLHRVMALGVGGAVAFGWFSTYLIAQNSFDVVALSSVTFTGPSTDTLMVLVDQEAVALSFGVGLVPGVALGAGTSALLAGQWKLQRFGADTPMERYLLGAVFMGFGAMLAGGCAVGAGMSGGSALSLTAWLAVFFMWVGAMATHHALKPRHVAAVG